MTVVCFRLKVTDKEGNQHTAQHNISSIFYSELQALFAPLPTQHDSWERIYNAVDADIGDDAQALLEQPITLAELQAAINQAPKNKSPGADGLTAEFYQWGIEILQNEILELYNTFFYNGPHDSEIHTRNNNMYTKRHTPKNS
jgi:hypothetical protein